MPNYRINDQGPPWDVQVKPRLFMSHALKISSSKKNIILKTQKHLDDHYRSFFFINNLLQIYTKLRTKYFSLTYV